MFRVSSASRGSQSRGKCGGGRSFEGGQGDPDGIVRASCSQSTVCSRSLQAIDDVFTANTLLPVHFCCECNAPSTQASALCIVLNCKPQPHTYKRSTSPGSNHGTSSDHRPAPQPAAHQEHNLPVRRRRHSHPSKTGTSPLHPRPTTFPSSHAPANPLADRLPRDAPAPLRAAAQGGHRLRRRVRPGQAAGAAGHGLDPGDDAVRLLLRGERADGVPAGGAAGVAQLHPLARRGAVQGAGALDPALHRRRRRARQARHVRRVPQRHGQRQPRRPQRQRRREERVRGVRQGGRRQGQDGRGAEERVSGSGAHVRRASL